MTKAERRKRARQRAKEREREAVAAPPVAPAETAAPPAEASPAPSSGGAPAPEESPYITAPIAAPAPRAAARVEVPSRQAQELIDEPLGDEDDDDEQDDDEDDDGDPDDYEDDDGTGNDDEDDDEFDDEVEDALFNAACGAVEQGDKLTWNELIGALCAAEVDDPRLGLLVALLVQQNDQGQPLPLTGARVLEVLTDLECEDIVEEAREVTEAAGSEEGESPEEKAIVRTNARELREQAERELEGKPKKRDASKPIKASQLRPPQTGLGQSIPVVGSGRRTVR